MKTLIALSAALLLAFTAPVHAGNVPVKKKHRQEMMTKKKKPNKTGKKKSHRSRGKGCDMVN